MLNVYTLKEAVNSASCDVCLKLTNLVLTNSTDWFYICASHTKDPGFCKLKQTKEGRMLGESIKASEVKNGDSKDDKQKEPKKLDKKQLEEEEAEKLKKQKEEAAKIHVNELFILNSRIYDGRELKQRLKRRQREDAIAAERIEELLQGLPDVPKH